MCNLDLLISVSIDIGCKMSEPWVPMYAPCVFSSLPSIGRSFAYFEYDFISSSFFIEKEVTLFGKRRIIEWEDGAMGHLSWIHLHQRRFSPMVAPSRDHYESLQKRRGIDLWSFLCGSEGQGEHERPE
jgi:hypothetical protein